VVRVQVLLCVILTGNVQVVAQPSGLSDSDQDALVAINTNSSGKFVVWSTSRWFVYTLGGLLLSTAQLSDVQADILMIDIYDDDDDDDCGGQRLRITWKSQEHRMVVADSHTLRVRHKHHHYHHQQQHLCLESNVVALSRRRQLV